MWWVAPSADLVRAPAGKVNVPVVELQRNVADGVCQIDTHNAALVGYKVE